MLKCLPKYNANISMANFSDPNITTFCTDSLYFTAFEQMEKKNEILIIYI